MIRMLADPRGRCAVDEPAWANRLTRLDVTARMWESVFPFLSGVGVGLLSLFVEQVDGAGEGTYWLTGVLAWLGLFGVYIPFRIVRDSLRSRRVLKREPWVECRIDFYYIAFFKHAHSAVWVRPWPHQSGPVELLQAYLLPIERRRWMPKGDGMTVWMAGTGKWRVISPVGGGKPKLARRVTPGTEMFDALESITAHARRAAATRRIEATERDAE